MDAESGTTHADLERALVEGGHRFDFAQAMLLLEALHPGGAGIGGAGPLAHERIRFRSDSNFGFPATDVASITREGGRGGLFMVSLHFLGLTGVSSPLPNYFVEPIVKLAEGGAALADFLAMFEHRFYSLYWRAWKKYRLDLTPSERGTKGRRLLLYLAGETTPAAVEQGPLDALRLVGFAGLLGVSHRTAVGLRNVVSGYFDGVPVRVIENVLRRVWVRHRAGLGGVSPPQLGEDALVGDSVRDCSGLLRVRIGPLDLRRYVGFLPRGDAAEALASLIRVYLPSGLDYQVLLILQHNEIPPLRLGHEHARIGRLTWLGRPAGDGESGPIPAAAFAAA